MGRRKPSDEREPYIDEPWLEPDGIPPPKFEHKPVQLVNLARPGREYSDEEEKQLRRREDQCKWRLDA